MATLQRIRRPANTSKPAFGLRPPSVRAVLANARQDPAASHLIAVHNLSKSYEAESGGRRALKSVSFSVRAGEFVFITGQTGSGKSTLLKLVHGQIAPDGGDISLGGVDIRRLDQKQFRRKVGFVAQDFEVLDRMTVAENIAYPLQMLWEKPARIEARVSELLEVFDLGHARNRLAGDSLSGGEQQRLAIARAIAHRPDLLLCDEPTGNLDRRTTYAVMAMLNRVSMTGTTVLCVTHEENLVDLMHKRVLLIRDGLLASDTIGRHVQV
jgi:cell division transport system ATP-binding protein